MHKDRNRVQPERLGCFHKVLSSRIWLKAAFMFTKYEGFLRVVGLTDHKADTGLIRKLCCHILWVVLFPRNREFRPHLGDDKIHRGKWHLHVSRQKGT